MDVDTDMDVEVEEEVGFGDIGPFETGVEEEIIISVDDLWLMLIISELLDPFLLCFSE